MTDGGNWKVQLSLKAGAHMLNVRGDSAMEVIAHLTQFFRNDANIADLAIVSFMEALETSARSSSPVATVATAAPAISDAAALTALATTLGATPAPTAYAPPVAAPAAAAPSATPKCDAATLAGGICGADKFWKEGVSQKSGKPYAFWACPNWRAHAA